MLNFLRKIFPDRSPMRLLYHKTSAKLAVLFYGMPAQRLKVIAVTGTSGKSTTVELIHYLLHNSGHKTGSISGIQFNIGDQSIHNKTLRTTLNPWKTQQLLRKMVKAGCEFAVIEVSSHALDQNRVWGIPVDTAILTNIYDNEHLEYHPNYADYVQTKAKLFRGLYSGYRKPNVPKVMILNRDDDNYDLFHDFPADRKWSYSTRKPSDVEARNLKLKPSGTTFSIDLPNHSLNIDTSIVGRHNVENMMAAIAAVAANGVNVSKIETLLKEFTGIPGRLEPINENQDFSVIVDFTYKPSALDATFSTLREMVDGKLIVIWGGCGGRPESHRQESMEILHKHCDEIILTTDDPNDEDPKKIAYESRKHLPRKEGEQFFEIEDRYEAIRYGIFISERKDCVMICGRGHEKTQKIGNASIDFDDRVVAREILQFAKKEHLIDEK